MGRVGAHRKRAQTCCKTCLLYPRHTTRSKILTLPTPVKPTTTLQTQANTGNFIYKHRQFHLQTQVISSLPYKKFMGFYRQRTKCQFLCARASGPANDDAGRPPWPTYFSPATNNNDDARPPSLPCRRRPAAPSNRTQLAVSTQSRHLVTTFSHQQRWCAKPARPAPAQPSGAAQGR